MIAAHEPGLGFFLNLKRHLKFEPKSLRALRFKSVPVPVPESSLSGTGTGMGMGMARKTYFESYLSTKLMCRQDIFLTRDILRFTA